MKEQLKDRIDVLLEKAKDNDGISQLKLAKCFYTGELVEKSTENALFWSFKAVSAGVPDAESYYNAITRGEKLPIGDKMRQYITLVENIKIFPLYEFFFGIIGLVVTSKVEVIRNFFIWLLLTGLISGVLAYIVQKVYKFFVKNIEIDVSGVVTIIIVHIVTAYYAISMVIG